MIVSKGSLLRLSMRKTLKADAQLGGQMLKQPVETRQSEAVERLRKGLLSWTRAWWSKHGCASFGSSKPLNSPEEEADALLQEFDSYIQSVIEHWLHQHEFVSREEAAWRREFASQLGHGSLDEELDAEGLEVEIVEAARTFRPR